MTWDLWQLTLSLILLHKDHRSMEFFFFSSHVFCHLDGGQFIWTELGWQGLWSLVSAELTHEAAVAWGSSILGWAQLVHVPLILLLGQCGSARESFPLDNVKNARISLSAQVHFKLWFCGINWHPMTNYTDTGQGEEWEPLMQPTLGLLLNILTITVWIRISMTGAWASGSYHWATWT